MATTQQPKYVTTADGRKITYERWKYEQTVAQEAAIRQVNDLITSEASAAVSVGAGFDQSEFGGLLRNIVPQLLDQYGRVNATAALQFYDSQRLMWAETYGPDASRMAGRANVRAQGNRYAAATTRSALAVSQGYAAQFADDYKLAAKADSVINFAMRVRQQQGHAPSVSAMNNALTREVAMYHRDTVLFNAGLDPFVKRVQRVAQAKACEFCRLMAIGSTTGSVKTSTYAVKFHSHCHCTIQPLFDGDQPVRPDYYDEFEKEYAEVSGGSAKDVLAKWRALDKKSAPEILEVKWRDKQSVTDLMRFQERAGFTAESLTGAEFDALYGYKASNYSDVNYVLRSPDLALGQFGDRLPKILQQVTDAANGIRKAPKVSQPFITNRVVTGDFARQLQQLEVGSSFTDLGFTSTTLSDDLVRLRMRPMFDNPVQLRIINEQGTSGVFIDTVIQPGFTADDIPSEAEWVIQAGTEFEIVNIEDGIVTVKTVVR